MLAPVYISTSTVRVLIVLHTRQHFIVFLNFSHAGERVEELHCGLICISLRTNKTRQLSYVCCTYWTLNGVLVEVFYPLLLLSWLPFLYFDLPSPLYILDTSAWAEVCNLFDTHMIYTHEKGLPTSKVYDFFTTDPTSQQPKLLQDIVSTIVALEKQ